MESLESRIQRLISKLSSDAAFLELIQVGKPAVPALIKALNNKDWEIRCDVVIVLGEIQDSAAVPALIQALQDKNENVRHVAYEALVNIGSPAGSALVQSLNHKEWYVRYRVTRALGKIKYAPAVPVLIQALKDEDSNVCAAARKALIQIGSPSAVLAFISLLHDSDELLRKEAYDAIFEIGVAAIPSLRQACSKDFQQRGKYQDIITEIRKKHGFGTAETNMPSQKDLDSLDLSRIAVKQMVRRPVASNAAIIQKKQIPMSG